MEKTILNITKIVSFIFFALAVIFIIMVWYFGDDAIETSANLQNNLLTPFMWVTFIAIGICAFFAIAFPIFQLAQSPKNAMRALIILGILIVLGGISYMLASNSLEGDVLQKQFMKGNLSAAGSKRVGTALIGTYILMGLTVLTALYSAVSSVFKK